MALKNPLPQQILSEAFSRRAEAYRRWRDAAEGEHAPAIRGLYEELAALECDRFEELAVRFFRTQPSPVRPARLGRHSSAMSRPDWSPPEGTSPALHAARDAAEDERQKWAALLRKTAEQAPERGILMALLEDARRVRDLVGDPERPKSR